MGVAIVTFAHGEEFRRQTARGIDTTRAYAARHGYPYIVYGDPELPLPWELVRPVAWYKLLAIRDQLAAGHDWVFWLDADTLIMDQSRRCEDWLDTDQDYVFSADPCCEVNSGVWFARHRTAVLRDLDAWFASPETPRWWEQWAINESLPAERCAIRPELSGILRFNGHFPRTRFYQHGRHWIFHAAGRQKFGKDISPLLNHFAHYIVR